MVSAAGLAPAFPRSQAECVVTLPALCHFNKEQTPLGDRFKPSIPTRGFTAVVSVFGAHLLRSPSIVKFVSLFLAARLNPRGHTASVTIPSSSSPNQVSRSNASSRCPFISVHSFDPFVSRSRTNKKPCSHRGKQGLKFYDSFSYLLTSGLSNLGS